MNETTPCLIWGTQAKELSVGLRDGASIDSPRAGGPYFVSGIAAALLQRTTEREKARLTSWLGEQRRLGEDTPEVTTKTLEDVERRPSLSVHERADRLLKSISLELDDIADMFIHHEYDGENNPLHCRMAWSESVRPEEMTYLMTYLENSAWIGDGYPNTNYRQITVGGYSRLSELDRTPADSLSAFVAMWFDESMGQVWDDAIKPGIEQAGYEAVRIGREEHVNKIDDEIIAELRRARFVVADFTQGADGARGGVYYEAGLAHGRGATIVFSRRKDCVDKVHFDTRQYNHIVWEAEKLDEFRDRLAKRIGAVIGDGSRKK